MGRTIPAKPEHHEFAKKWLLSAEQLYAAGKFRTHRLDLRHGGFEGILEGLDDLKNGKASGVKLVYRVADP